MGKIKVYGNWHGRWTETQLHGNYAITSDRLFQWKIDMAFRYKDSYVRIPHCLKWISRCRYYQSTKVIMMMIPMGEATKDHTRSEPPPPPSRNVDDEAHEDYLVAELLQQEAFEAWFEDTPSLAWPDEDAVAAADAQEAMDAAPASSSFCSAGSS